MSVAGGMSNLAMAALIVVAAAGCDGAAQSSTVQSSTVQPSTVQPRTIQPTKPAAALPAWCPKVPALSEHWSGRVKPSGASSTSATRTNRRYGLAILRDCPGVVEVGVSIAPIAQRLQHNEPMPSAPITPNGHDFVLVIGLKTASAMPRGAMFLDDVPVYFWTSGPFKLA